MLPDQVRVFKREGRSDTLSGVKAAENEVDQLKVHFKDGKSRVYLKRSISGFKVGEEVIIEEPVDQLDV